MPCNAGARRRLLNRRSGKTCGKTCGPKRKTPDCTVPTPERTRNCAESSRADTAVADPFARRRGGRACQRGTVETCELAGDPTRLPRPGLDPHRAGLRESPRTACVRERKSCFRSRKPLRIGALHGFWRTARRGRRALAQKQRKSLWKSERKSPETPVPAGSPAHCTENCAPFSKSLIPNIFYDATELPRAPGRRRNREFSTGKSSCAT